MARNMVRTSVSLRLYSRVPSIMVAIMQAMPRKILDGYLEGKYDAWFTARSHSDKLAQINANLQPYLVVNFCIALVGIFPSRN